MVFESGLNSTCPTQVVSRGKLDTRSDSPNRRSCCSANLIAITLVNLDIETIKHYLIFQNLGLMLFRIYFSSPFCLAFTLYDLSRLLPITFLSKRYCYDYEFNDCTSEISILMIDTQVRQVEGLFSSHKMPFLP